MLAITAVCAVFGLILGMYAVAALRSYRGQR